MSKRIIVVLVVTGFALGITGFGLILFGAPEVGASIFLLGFLAAAVGVMSAPWVESSVGTQKPLNTGLRIFSIGFGLCVVSALLEFGGQDISLAATIFYIGMAVGSIGILYGIWHFKDHHP